MFILGFALFLMLFTATALLSALLLQTRAARREMSRRTDMVAQGAIARPRQRLPAGLAPRMVAASEWIRRILTIGMPHRWGMRAGPGVLVLVALGGGGIAWFMLHVLFHVSLWIALPLTAAAVFFAPRQILKHQQDTAEQKFLNLFPDAIDMVVRMVRAGLPVMAAIRTIGDEAPEPVNAVFAGLADQVDIGILFDEALVQAGERVGLADFRFFAVAVSLQHATGGNIAATLDILADIIRKRRAARLRAKSTTGEVRVSAFILGSLPFVVITGLLIMSPGYLTPLITDPRGNAIVGAAIISLGLGFLTMRQMMRRATQL